jgi:hypothetical protein
LQRSAGKETGEAARFRSRFSKSLHLARRLGDEIASCSSHSDRLWYRRTIVNGMSTWQVLARIGR